MDPLRECESLGMFAIGNGALGGLVVRPLVKVAWVVKAVLRNVLVGELALP